jgi:hypothetical protein
MMDSLPCGVTFSFLLEDIAPPAQTLSIQQPPPVAPPVAPPQAPQPTPAIPTTPSIPSIWHKAHQWSLRFALHLVLISLFETIFFWQYVSSSEDTALISLVNTYANEILSSCGNMTTNQRIFVNDLFNAFINQTVINQQGLLAAQSRTSYNSALLRNSWLYFSGLVGIFGVLCGLTWCSADRKRFHWRHIMGENIALVTLLGLYEFMFFRTVVFQYDAVSVPELDRMLVGEFEAQCGIH